MQPKISIVLPVYNAGNHLYKCLDTLIGQTLKEIEIILVLDCPTDGSDKIAKQYAEKDHRIIVVENKGSLHIGYSRNKGLDIARGEYIAFSDHDDYRELDMYEQLYAKAIEQQADMVVSCATELLAGEKKVWSIPEVPQKELRGYILSNLIGGGNYENKVSWFCNLHNNLYKKTLLIENKIQFVDTREITPEDLLFNIQASFYSAKIIYLNKSFYYHVILSTSEGSGYDYTNWRKRSAGMNVLYDFLQEHRVYKQFEINFLYQVNKQFLNSLLSLILHRKTWKEFIVAYKTIKQLPYTRKSFKHYIPDLQARGALKIYARKVLAYYLSK